MIWGIIFLYSDYQYAIIHHTFVMSLDNSPYGIYKKLISSSCELLSNNSLFGVQL